MRKSGVLVCLSDKGGRFNGEADERDPGSARRRGRNGRLARCRRNRDAAGAGTHQDRDLALAQRRLLRSGEGRQAWVRPLGFLRERSRRDPRPPGSAQDRRRRLEPEPGRHELPDVDHARPRRSRVRAVLVTAHRARRRPSRTATTTHSSSRRAAARRSSRSSCPTCSSCSPRPSSNAATASSAYLKTLPASQRPKTASYASLDDPFASPIADAMRSQLQASGVKTVYHTIYPAETTDLTPIIAKAIAPKPDMIIGGTQSDDAYAQVKALIQAKYSPKFLFYANGANSPTEFPSKVGAKNVNGIFSCSDWTPTEPSNGNALFVAQYLKRYGGNKFLIDNNSAEAWAVGQLLQLAVEEDRDDRQPDADQDAAQGHLADDRREPLVGRLRAAERQRPARRVDSRQAAAGVPEAVRAREAVLPEARLGRLIERIAPDALLHPSLHPGLAHRRRLCADGERSRAGLRSHEGDQRRARGVDHPRGLSQLHALHEPRHRPVRRAARHHPGDVRAGCGAAVRLPAPAA